MARKQPKTQDIAQVPDPAAFAEECRKVIAKALGNRQLGFNPEKYRLPGNHTLYTLSGVGATQAEAKYRYPVILFHEVQGTKLWLAASLEFEFQELYRLINVSLLIFEGEAVDNRKLALLRAEWQSRQPNDLPSHAQPHWHVYTWYTNRDSPGFKEASDIQTFTPVDTEISPGNFPETGLDKIDKFHLAMAARWCTEGENSHCQELKADDITKWLAGCLRYIRSQFEYVYAKPFHSAV
jgi:hypothetical protein